MFHPHMSIHALEYQTETGGTNQNEEHKAGQFGGSAFLTFNDTTNTFQVAGNLIASGNVIARKITSPSGDLHISAATNDPNNIIRFDSVSAFDIPAGTSDQRPPTPDYGYVRYNMGVWTLVTFGTAVSADECDRLKISFQRHARGNEKRNNQKEFQRIFRIFISMPS